MYTIILAGTAQEANTYAKRAKLPRGRHRYAVRAASIKGLRVAEIHELPSFSSRPDKFAIDGVLRHTKGKRIRVEMPEPLRPSLEEAYAELERDIDLLIKRADEAVKDQSDRVAEVILTEHLEAARAISSWHATALVEAFTPAPHEEPDGEEAGAPEQSEDAAPAEEVESPVELHKRPAAPEARKRRSRCKVCDELTLGEDDPAHDAAKHAASTTLPVTDGVGVFF